MVLEVVQQAWRLDATHRAPEHSLKPTFAVLQHDGGHGQLDVPEPLLPGGVVTCSTQSSSSCNDCKTDTIPQAEGGTQACSQPFTGWTGSRTGGGSASHNWPSVQTDGTAGLTSL